jgi:hypothetical protein
MYTEIGGKIYPVDNVIAADDELRIVFSDTPIEDVDRAAMHLPDRISIHQRDGPPLEYRGYTSAVSIQKNPSNQQTMLVLREG